MLHPFDAVEFFRNLVLQLHLPYVRWTISLQEKIATMGLNDLIEQIGHRLEGKRYLIVLDDVSSTEEWNLIIRHMPKKPTASRIILTTKEESVARYCSRHNENVSQLEAPKDEHASDLFKKKVVLL